MVNVFELIAEIEDIQSDTLLNKEQKKTFLESTVMSFVLMLEPEDLPALKAAVKCTREIPLPPPNVPPIGTVKVDPIA